MLPLNFLKSVGLEESVSSYSSDGAAAKRKEQRQNHIFLQISRFPE